MEVHEDRPTQDVNNGQLNPTQPPPDEQIYPCVICHDHCDTGIKCNDCQMWTHYSCTQLPMQCMVILIKTSRKYMCHSCAKQNFADYDDKAKEIQGDMVKERSTTETSKDEQNKGETPDTQPAPLTPSEATPERDPTPVRVQPQGQQGEQKTQSSSVAPNTVSTSTQGTSNRNGEGTSSNPGLQTTHKDEHQQAAPQDQQEGPICRYYRRGNCRHGPLGKDCKYRHPKPCRKLLNHGIKGENGCRLGGRCTMFHPRMCNNSIRKGECLVESCRYMHIKGTKRTAQTQPSTQQTLTTGQGSPPTVPQSSTQQTQNLTPPPTLSASENFLGVMTDLRTDLENLLKAMQTQSSLMSSILANKSNNSNNNNRVVWQGPPQQSQIAPGWAPPPTTRNHHNGKHSGPLPKIKSE